MVVAAWNHWPGFVAEDAVVQVRLWVGEFSGECVGEHEEGEEDSGCHCSSVRGAVFRDRKEGMCPGRALK